jgi:hypothetical protein
MNNIIQSWDVRFVESMLHTFTPTIIKDKKYIPCRIKVNGEFIQTNSGKSLWKCKAHAKSALKNHLRWKFDREIEQYFPSLAINGRYGGMVIPRDTKTRCYHEFIDFLQNQGILEFVELYD